MGMLVLACTPAASRLVCAQKVEGPSTSPRCALVVQARSGGRGGSSNNKNNKPSTNRNSTRRKGRPAWLRSPDDTPYRCAACCCCTPHIDLSNKTPNAFRCSLIRDGNRDRLMGLLTDRYAAAWQPKGVCCSVAAKRGRLYRPGGACQGCRTRRRCRPCRPPPARPRPTDACAAFNVPPQGRPHAALLPHGDQPHAPRLAAVLHEGQRDPAGEGAAGPHRSQHHRGAMQGIAPLLAPAASQWGPQSLTARRLPVALPSARPSRTGAGTT